MTEKQISILRVAGSFALCAAYLTITSGALVQGVLLNMLGQALLLPFGLKTKSWDLVALSAFFVAVNLRVLIGT